MGPAHALRRQSSERITRPHSTAPNSIASAWKRISSPRPNVPASKPSFSSTPPANAPCSGSATARLTLLPEELQREWIVNARMLHLDGHDTAAATQAAQWAREANIPVVADLDDLYPWLRSAFTQHRFPHHQSRYSRAPDRTTHDLHQSLPQVPRNATACRLTAATLGQDGVLAWDGRQFHYAPAYRVDPVDTTGAGDTFHAGFIYGFLQGWPLQRQLEFACAAAALNCTAVGARGGIQPVAQIEHFMATNAKHPAAF